MAGARTIETTADVFADDQPPERRQSESLVVGDLPNDAVETLAAAEFGKTSNDTARSQSR